MGLSPEQAIVLATLARAAGADVDLASAQADSGLPEEAFEGALKALCARGLARWAADRCFTTRAGMQAHAELPPRPDPRANTPHRPEQPRSPGARPLFVACSHADDTSCASLCKHLALLQDQGLLWISTLRVVGPSGDWREVVSEALESADLFLLLLSADMSASGYLQGAEMKRAMERHAAGTTRVVPILLRACLWRDAPFAKLQPLPRSGSPVATWPRADDAWTDIADEIRTLVERPPIKADRTTRRR